MGVRDTFEDAMWLVLKMEEGPWAKECRWTVESGIGIENRKGFGMGLERDFILPWITQKIQARQSFCSKPLLPISGICSLEL